MNIKYCPVCRSELAEEDVDGNLRLACPEVDCDYVFWDNPAPVAAAIVELDDKVVLVRNKGWPDTWFGIVTGFLERNESPEMAALREVKEELGLDGEIVSLIGLYSFRRMNQIIMAYHVKTQGEIQVGEELAEVKLVHPDDLIPWSIGTGQAVRDWLDQRARGETE